MRNLARSLSLPLVAAALSLWLAPAAFAVNIDWVPVGNPGNAPDDTGFGSVAYEYQIGKFEVTNAQYTEFLNAKAASDPLGLYNTSMSSSFGGITRTGSDGTYTYSEIAGRENAPVNYVSFYDGLRFANWLKNGQGSGDTETGSYTLLGGTPVPTNGTTVTRNAGATIVLTSEDEWYKAAYYNALSTSYFLFPAGFDAPTACAPPSPAPNTANCANANLGQSAVGSYTGSPSPYGTFDQGGNVWETMDDAPGDLVIRGGSLSSTPNQLAALSRSFTDGGFEGRDFGFRLAMVPEPGTGLLVMGGMLALAGWRRRRA